MNTLADDSTKLILPSRSKEKIEPVKDQTIIGLLSPKSLEPTRTSKHGRSNKMMLSMNSSQYK